MLSTTERELLGEVSGERVKQDIARQRRTSSYFRNS